MPAANKAKVINVTNEANKAKPMSIGALIDAMYTTREARRTIAAEDDKLKAVYDDLQTQLIARLEKEDTDNGRGKLASASLSELEVYSIKDFETFCKYVARHKLFHFFQRRLSDPSIREVVEKKGSVPPGLEQFSKKTINLRSL